jgi:cell division protein FtsW (lipid II flippase)
LTHLVTVDERAIGHRTAAGRLNAAVAVAIVLALIGVLFYDELSWGYVVALAGTAVAFVAATASAARRSPSRVGA